MIHLYLKNVYLKKVRTFPVIFHFQKDTNGKVCSNIWFIIHCLFLFFFSACIPLWYFQPLPLARFWLIPKLVLKKQVSWKSSDCTEIITLFTSVALCLLNRSRELEVSNTQYWKLQIIFMMFLHYMLYNQVPWISGGICQFIKLNESS